MYNSEYKQKVLSNYVGILTSDATFNQGCKGLLPKNKTEICAEFYYYFLSHKQNELQNRSSGSTFKELTKEFFGSFEVLQPPLSEQRKIAEILSSIDNRIDIAERERSSNGSRWAS